MINFIVLNKLLTVVQAQHEVCFVWKRFY